MKRGTNSKTLTKSFYRKKLVKYIILFIIFLSISLFCAINVTIRRVLNPIKYSQEGFVDYKVFLNDNEFFTEKYLEMNKTYIASLIDYIDVNFNYIFNIDEGINADFDYKIIGKLVISNSNGSNNYLEKDYVLLDNKSKKLENGRDLVIKENVKIDYGYYNDLANKFRIAYGVDTNSFFSIYLLVNTKTPENEKYNISENNQVVLKLPLSERAIEINLDTENNSIIKQIYPEKEVTFNIVYLIAEILFAIPACVFIIKIFKYLYLSLDGVTLYDQFVKKILKEYDRLIVESQTNFDLRKYHVIYVKDFNELLDVRDNLKLPIVYLNVEKHESGFFYVIEGKNLYCFKVDNDSLRDNKR